MVSHDLTHPVVTNEIAANQQDLHSTSEFERPVDHRYQAPVSNSGVLRHGSRT